MQADVVNALGEAANLLVVGMGVVFLFLTLLIGAVTLIAWLNSLFPEESANSIVNSQSFNQASSSSTNSQKVSPKVVAAITTAIRQYRRTH